MRDRLQIQADFLSRQADLQKQYQAGDITKTLYDSETQALNDALAERLQALAAPDACLLVDCLTLWLTNLLLLDDPLRLEQACTQLLDAVPQLPGHLIFVSNETGLGVVPLGELTRRYVDAAGELHQALAARCERVVLTVAGLPLTLKGTPL